MKFVANGVKYELDQDKITFAEAKAIQKAVGKSMGEIRDDPGDIAATQAMVWVAMKRQDPTLKFLDLDDMAIGDVEFEDEDEDGEQGGPDPQVPAAEPIGALTPSE